MSPFSADNQSNMVNLFFFLKFKSQLRRTRPDIVRQIDESLIRMINDAGGKITGDRFVISAVFNEDTIGFWLDMYILIENLERSISLSKDFFGYSLIICAVPPNSPELLCRYLANHSGVFVDEETARNLLPYAGFIKPSEWLKGIRKIKYGCYNYFKIRELKTFKAESDNDLNINNYITEKIKLERGKNVLVLGKSNLPLRGGLLNYSDYLNDNFPALTVCFDSAGAGSLVDIWSLNIRSIRSGESPEVPTEEIDALWEYLFHERVRDDVSEYVGRCVKKFLRLVIDYYINAARIKMQIPFLILENIHLAENSTMSLLLDVLTEYMSDNRQILLILGTADVNITKVCLSKWENVFEKIIRIDGVNGNISTFKLSSELWEIIYAISVFNRYFSPELFLRLFEEEDKNPVMITKALSILSSLGIIDSIREPRLVFRQYEEYAYKALSQQGAALSGYDTSLNLDMTGNSSYTGTVSVVSPLNNRIERVKKIVRSRLISWADKRNLNPCFRLLSIIAALGGIKQIDDMLLLKALTFDIVNKTTYTIESSMKNGQFQEMLSAKAALIRHIYKTSKALDSGVFDEIERAFTETKEEMKISEYDGYPVLYAQMIVNFCCYYLCMHDEKEAVEKAKEAILLGQNKNSYCLPQSYRLFALVCLTKQRINETIEYLGFALTTAEKIGNYHELAISAYYAASVQFLFGDIYTAANLARKCVEQSLAAGHPDWADRARFLEGRLEFELGHYTKALNIFDELRKQSYGIMTTEKENLLSAWIYRSKIYLNDSENLKPKPANFDADMFEIEKAYLSENYKKALELSETIQNPFIDENFLYTEKADWQSGFSQCEHLYFTKGEIQTRMIGVFKYLSLSGLSLDNDQCENDTAVQGIQQILRDEKLCEIDPWESFYFYSKYRILQKTEASQVDLSTAVSMAFKRIQRRAGRIEDVETRRQYLNGPRWNHELSLAAKEFKLI